MDQIPPHIEKILLESATHFRLGMKALDQVRVELERVYAPAPKRGKRSAINAAIANEIAKINASKFIKPPKYDQNY